MDENQMFDVVIVNGMYALYSNTRITPGNILDSYQMADIRGDDDSGVPYCLEPHVTVNYCGSLIFRNQFQYPRGTKQLIIDSRGIEYTCIRTTLEGYGDKSQRRSAFNVVRTIRISDLATAKMFIKTCVKPGVFYQYSKTTPGEPHRDVVFAIMGMNDDERVPYIMDRTMSIEGFPVGFMRAESIEQLEQDLVGTKVTMVYGTYCRSTNLQY